MLVFLSGLFAGSLHVVSGPDHVAAVAPLAMGAPRTGASLGAAWGVGHGSGVLLWMGVAGLLRAHFGYELRPELLESLVGVALIALGVVTLSSREPTHHDHAPRARVAALTMGALHGSAGASHLLALIPTLGLPRAGAFAYACGYLVAGVLAMAGVAGLIGRMSLQRSDLTKLRRGCATLVIALGVVWLASAIVDLT